MAKRPSGEDSGVEKVSLRILIGGDIAPTPSTIDLLIRGTAVEMAPDHADLISSADLMIANLEAPVCGPAAKSAKCGPALRIPPASLAGLKALGVGALGLANNHIMDYGVAGLKQTIEALKELGIGHFGAGLQLEQANEPLHMTINGRTIGVLAVGAQEFGVARHDRPGMSPMDPVNVIPSLTRLCRTSDFRIVLVHAGSEGHAYPSPWLQGYCRMLGELGADVVVCQHSHRVGCQERHGASTLVYGQGNFLMDLPESTPAFYREGLLIEILLPETGSGHDVLFHPLRQDPLTGCVKHMTPERESDFLEEFRRRSAQVSDPQFVQSEWLGYCRFHSKEYKAKLSVANRILLRLITNLGLSDALLGTPRRLLLQNLIRCQDHREALLTILEEGL
jgi:hypothetical protein